ncbi:MAG: hypothetical protein JXR15_16185 [Shimia sp.]|uniref:hypothetical protein n=1 Tax=Shimia sp. TaxID=1954381 RepID=UPI003B8E89F5
MFRPKLDLRPPRSLNPLQVMWVLWAVLATALLTISAWAFATRFPVNAARVASGAFESQTPTVDVVLPADVTLAEVLITNGDQVTSGQKVARLDQTALHRLLHNLRRDIANTSAAVACWRAAGQPSPPGSPEANTALQACQNTKRQELLAREQLLHRRESLQRETALAVRELVLRAENTPPAIRNILMLRAALERETLQSLVRDVEFELAQLVQTQEAGRLAQVVALEAQTAALQTRVIELEEIAAAPWLYAPQDGRIERLRRMPDTAARAWDVTLAQIHNASPAAYQARFVLSMSEADALRSGDPLHISLAGIPHPHNRFPAHVQSISSINVGDVAAREVLVRLSNPGPQAQAALRTLPAGTRSTMQVELPMQRLGHILGSATERLLQSF